MMEGLLNFKDYFNQVKRQIILNNYYTKRMKGGKSIPASLMDWIFVSMLLALFFLITIFNSTRNIILSIILTTVLIIVYIIILIAWKSRIRYKKINEINDDIATK